MKRNYPLTIAFILLTMSRAYSQDDKAAIQAVIEKETTAFFGVDKINWESNWLNASYTYWTYADSVSGSFVEGTEGIKKNFSNYFETARPSTARIEREWLEIRIYGKGAYVRFIQKVIDEIDHDETSETRVLEKDKDGKWKIVFLSAVARK